MEISTLNQTLIELEENLKKIESSRNQVNSVAQKSESLIVAFSKVLEQLNNLSLEFDVNEEGMMSSIVDSVAEFNSNVEVKATGFAVQIEKLNHAFNSEVHDVNNKLNSLSKVIETKIEEFKSFDFDGNLNSLNSTIINFTENFADFITANSQSVNSLNNDIDKLIKQEYTTKTNILQNIDLFKVESVQKGLAINNHLSSIIKNQIDFNKETQTQINQGIVGVENKVNDLKSIIEGFIIDQQQADDDIIKKLNAIGSRLDSTQQKIENLNNKIDKLDDLVKTESQNISSQLLLLQKESKITTLWNRIIFVTGILGLILFELMLNTGIIN